MTNSKITGGLEEDVFGGEELKKMKDSVLSVVVVGASGDLAKKKTYPSFLNLFADGLLPDDVLFWGFARSPMSDDKLRDRIRPFLVKGKHPDEVVDKFLAKCRYSNGKTYGDVDALGKVNEELNKFEKSVSGNSIFNRLFYFAIPPNVFAATGEGIKKTCIQDPSKGWSRLIIEKPFGRDLESFEKLNKAIADHYDEEQIYRIDHYLGKEIVQNLSVLRFSNTWFEPIWNAENISNIILTFKEPFGTQGRGGYFDKYGIIRDILQNHLLQVLTLLCMEPPTIVEGAGSGKAIRDAKVAVLNAIPEVSIDDCVLGQYEGYSDDDTIENSDTNCPTFAAIRLKINTRRWAGVPIIMKAGKALDERKAEMRIQFKDAPAAEFMFDGHDCPRNELVMRMQPSEAVYMKTNVKSPGFEAKPIQSELEVNYDSRFYAHESSSNQDAYTRLILDVLRGKQAAFVRDDELRRAWAIFTPVLHKIENECIRPIVYEQGSRGPPEADEFIAKVGRYKRNENYVFHQGAVARKTEGTTTLGKTIKEFFKSFSEEDKCDIGLWGLAVMGQNFALNMASHGFKVCVGNRSQPKVETTVKRAASEGGLPLVGSKDAEEFVARLSKPRKIVILVQAGKPVDDTIAQIAKYLEAGDVIIDGGNEWFPNSQRRAEFLKPKGIHFIGMGISGGEEGARNGPSLMPGGPKEAYDLVGPIFEKCAAQVDGIGPCAAYLGPVGAGNYVKMVHNGIEYGDMQLIAEVYDVLKLALGMGNEEIADVFAEWNKTELDSYLIEITEKIFRKKDDQNKEGHVVDYVLDKTGMKGTGLWTVQEGAGQGVAIPTMSAALDARMLSARLDERQEAAKVLDAPAIKVSDHKQVIDDLRAALYASKVCSYAQGLSLIKTASDKFSWNVDLASCARLWMGGCIIRAKLLYGIQKAFGDNPDLNNLMLDSKFSSELNERSTQWRRVVALCVTSGIACPSLCGSLTYFDTYRRARLPANLTQAQRDFFGGHTYERVDKTGRFHCVWTDAHKDIGDVSGRTAGEDLK